MYFALACRERLGTKIEAYAQVPCERSVLGLGGDPLQRGANFSLSFQ
jgi:hypothetical protein